MKKLLEYDPYLDPNIAFKIPKEWDDPKYFEAHPEKKAEADQKIKESEEALSKLRNDKEANIIFARQDYQIKDGVSMGLDREKSYLYLAADEEFLSAAEPKLKKTIASIERVSPEVESQIIDTIEKERQKADTGLGLIFG